MIDHTVKLAQIFRDAADDYMKAHPDTNINDVLTATAVMLVMHCIVNDVSRTETLTNVSATYDAMETTRGSVMGKLN